MHIYMVNFFLMPTEKCHIGVKMSYIIRFLAPDQADTIFEIPLPSPIDWCVFLLCRKKIEKRIKGKKNREPRKKKISRAWLKKSFCLGTSTKYLESSRQARSNGMVFYSVKKRIEDFCKKNHGVVGGVLRKKIRKSRNRNLF